MTHHPLTGQSLLVHCSELREGFPPLTTRAPKTAQTLPRSPCLQPERLPAASHGSLTGTGAAAMPEQSNKAPSRAPQLRFGLVDVMGRESQRTDLPLGSQQATQSCCSCPAPLRVPSVPALDGHGSEVHLLDEPAREAASAPRPPTITSCHGKAGTAQPSPAPQPREVGETGSAQERRGTHSFDWDNAKSTELRGRQGEAAQPCVPREAIPKPRVPQDNNKPGPTLSCCLSHPPSSPLCLLFRHLPPPGQAAVVVVGHDIVAGEILLRLHEAAALVVLVRSRFDDVAKAEDKATGTIPPSSAPHRHEVSAAP